jgi:hypothetical protein
MRVNIVRNQNLAMTLEINPPLSDLERENLMRDTVHLSQAQPDESRPENDMNRKLLAESSSCIFLNE